MSVSLFGNSSPVTTIRFLQSYTCWWTSFDKKGTPKNHVAHYKKGDILKVRVYERNLLGEKDKFQYTIERGYGMYTTNDIAVVPRTFIVFCS